MKTIMAKERKYDLEKRTTCFAEQVIETVKKIKQDPINRSIISQLVNSSGSVGANYYEATEAESRRDFVHEICISKKEIKETQHWLRLLAKSNPEYREKFLILWKESQELLLIFSKIASTAKSRMTN